MGDIRVQLSEDLHWRIKLQAMQERRTLQKFLQSIVPKGLEAYLAQKAQSTQEAQVTKVKPTSSLK